MAGKQYLHLSMLLGGTLAVAGCGISIPTDPEGTLDRISGATLRVGVTGSGEWVQLDAGQDPAGIEPDLVRDFAESVDAQPRWIPGSEHELAEDLKNGELDLVIGGLADNTPWSTHAGMTRPYAESTDKRGEAVRHVMLVPRGENAFLLALDRFLLEQKVTP
ncbi:transporter substrate-binding domain-containing protein [Arthrobacter sp. Br18]|uniref:transporter substrate-binding domain-containing protein n=1 Tax=Arthrobacter sp. Br18 TaxID=1312954 RepID=UPI00047DAEC3|nr:transporter substrate-binding domain-containing protein [Arthrobacter sp. Br18]